MRLQGTYLQEWRKAHEAGFGNLWPVHQDYHIRKPSRPDRLAALVPKGRVVRWYAAAAEPRLPGELAKVEYGELSPEEFASRYGLLGFSWLVPPKRRAGGDPLMWVQAHARTVALVLELLERVREFERARGPEAAERARLNLKEFLVRAPEGRLAQADEMATIREWEFWLATRRTWARNPLPVAYDLLRFLVNPNLAGVRRQLDRDQTGRPGSFFRFRAMIEAVYWQLADQIERGRVRRCAECNRPFIATDQRKIYCPPPPGVGRSRCANRFNIRTWRRKKRKEARQ